MISGTAKLLLGAILSVALAGIAMAGPQIKLEGKSKIDFGRYSAKERKDAIFKFTNAGDAELRINGIRKTCGCAAAKMDKMVIAPGDTATLTAVILGDSIYGAYAKKVYILSNDQNQKILSVTVTGNAVPLLAVKPKNHIYAGRLPDGKPWTQTFLLEGLQDVELLKPIVKSSCPSEHKLERISAQKYKLTVTVTPNSGSGPLKCEVKIPVQSPKGWNPVVVTITGKSGMELHPLPSRVGLPGSAEKDVVRRIHLRLLGSPDPLAPEKIEITGVEGLSFESIQVNKNTVKTELTFTPEAIAALRKQKYPKLKLSYPGTADSSISISMR